MTELDALDRRLLVELQRDASRSNAELASAVGSTAPSCWRRIRRLEDEGLLGPTVRLVDQAGLGQGVNVICNIRLRNHGSESSVDFETFVRDERRILECYSMSGDWDYLLRVVAADVADYELFLMRTLLKHPAVASVSSHFALRVAKYQTAIPVPS